MKVLLFLCLFSITLIFAQEEIELLNPSCTNLKRLDAKGKVLDGHPIQHQGNLSTCYANTSSIMFFTKLQKDNPNKNLEQLSWLSLAQKSKEDKLKTLTDKKITQDIFKEGGWITQVYRSVKGKKICAIPSKQWSNDEFNQSLETNSYTFEKIMDKYQILFEDESIFESIKENNQYISSTCFDKLNHSFDIDLKKKLPKARHVKEFSEFWKYLKVPKVENLRRFKDYYMTHIFTSTLLKNESNALNFLYVDSFLNGPQKKFPDVEISKLIAKDQIKDFKESFYYNASNVAQAQQDALTPTRDLMKKEFALCIENSLKIDPFNKKSMCSFEKDDETKKVIDFISTATNESISPRFIKDVLTMNSPLRTKQEILKKFMDSAYTDCNYSIPTNWNVKAITNKKDLIQRSKDTKKNLFDFSFEVYDTILDMDLAASISVRSNLLLNQSKLPKKDGNHAMSVIGTAKGCNINKKPNQKCILIQNSYGQKLEDPKLQGTKKSRYASYMIPAFKSTNTTTHNNKTYKDENVGYGKFWICDQEAIEKYITGLGVIN